MNNLFYVGQRVRSIRYFDEGIIVSTVGKKGYLVDYDYTTVLEGCSDIAPIETPDEIFKEMLNK